MVDDKVTLDFEIERGGPIAVQSHFSARIKLTDESKNLLREKLGSTVKFDNLDSYLDLDYGIFISITINMVGIMVGMRYVLKMMMADL